MFRWGSGASPGETAHLRGRRVRCGAAFPVSVCVCWGGAAGAAAGDPPSPVPRQAQQRPRRAPLQELQLQSGADRTNLTPLLRRLRLKVGVQG